MKCHNSSNNLLSLLLVVVSDIRDVNMDTRKHLLVGAGAAAGTAAVILGAPAVVSALGFGAAGVKVGSIAAAWQSASYGGLVTSGSLFAGMQSVGATGSAALSYSTMAATASGAGMLPGKRMTSHYSSISASKKKLSLTVIVGGSAKAARTIGPALYAITNYAVAGAAVLGPKIGALGNTAMFRSKL